MLDDLFDPSPFEKVLTFYFTMCTIMSSIILQSLGLLVALKNFIWFLYQNTIFFPMWNVGWPLWPFTLWESVNFLFHNVHHHLLYNSAKFEPSSRTQEFYIIFRPSYGINGNLWPLPKVMAICQHFVFIKSTHIVESYHHTKCSRAARSFGEIPGLIGIL
jgi:hypothetical protein